MEAVIVIVLGFSLSYTSYQLGKTAGLETYKKSFNILADKIIELAETHNKLCNSLKELLDRSEKKDKEE